jgi:hypothetical protein
MLTKRLRFSSLSPDARKEYGVGTIPFAQGEWFGSPDNITMLNQPDSRPLSVRPFGARYADGSYRYGQACVPLLLAAYGQQDISIQFPATPGPSIPPQTPILLPINFTPPVIINGAAVPATAVRVHQMETNPARTVLRIVYRTGNFIVTTYLYLYKDQSFYPYEIRVTGSNPSNTDLMYPVTSMVLSVPNTILSVYGAERRGAQRTGLSSITLASNTSFGNGQSQCWYGNAYIPTGNETTNIFAAELNTLNGISLDWRESHAYGSFGTIPDALTADPAAKFQYASVKFGEFYQYKSTVGNLWDDMPYGLTKNPGATGDQRDFGMISGWDVIDSGRPELLEMYRFYAIEDAMRPGHYMEANGDPVTSAAHPNWVTWSGVTHWHAVVSPDKLGKTGVASGLENREWFGKDNQHWSSNLLGCAAVLTPSYQLVDELNVEAELFLSGHTLPSMKPGWATNGMDAPRAVGRVYNSMALNYLVTGREDIKARIAARTTECVLQQWTGRNTNPVRPLGAIGPDGRQLPLYPSWLPWNEALGIPGLEAWFQLTGLQIYRDLAVIVAKSMVDYGWRITTDATGQITSYDVGNAVRWYEDGTPITAEQYFDTTQTYYNPSVVMSIWAVSALKIVRDHYQALVPAATHQRATQLLALITAGRVGPYDRVGEWLI